MLDEVTYGGFSFQIMLSQLCRTAGSSTNPLPEISEENRRKFDQWWAAQFSPQSPANRPPFIPSYPVPPQAALPMERQISESHPALKTVHNQYPTQKTRMRSSFDPEMELPKLQRWFNENPHPTRQQIQIYVQELNDLESRRDRKHLDINNVVYWFKNARAAQKRAELRSVSTPNLQLPVNGYNHHSPTNGGQFLLSDPYLSSERLMEHRLKNNLSRRGPQNSTSDEFSNAGSDIDDDDMTNGPPSSPTGPLSLTTRKDSRDRSPLKRSPPPPSDIEVGTSNPNDMFSK